VLAFATVVLYRQYQKQKASAMPKAIAVLPFKTIGAEPEPDVLGLGMADALIIKLSNLKQLTVLPTSSVFRYTSREKDAMAIGHELGVEGVLDGTVQRDGGRIRVTAQLIRVSDGKTVWSGKFDERYGGLFSLQDSISEQVIASLAAEVDSNRTSTAHLTNDTQAYQDYLTGLYFWNRRTRENLPKAISYLEKAAARDPNFGQAYAILADCYYLTAQDEYELASMKEAIPRADASVNRALELDPNSAEAHTVKAGILLARRMFDEAGTEFRRALELKPTYAVAHLRYGYYLFWSLKLDESLQAMRRAQELDPVSPVTNGALAVMLLNARDYDNSIKFSKRALELEAGATAARLNLAEAYVQKRMFTEALYELDRVSPSHVYALQEKAYALAAAGHSGQALKLLSKPEMNVERVGPFFYARIYGAMGNKEKAFEWLDKIYINRMNVAALKYDAQLDPLRSDERFNEFLRKHNIQYD
jgi:serine/threonine-protein kinase